MLMAMKGMALPANLSMSAASQNGEAVLKMYVGNGCFDHFLFYI